VLTDTIDLEDIPQQFGGKLAYQHGAAPTVDKGISQVLNRTSTSSHKLPVGPLKWVIDQQGRKAAFAVGKIHGEKRREMFGTLQCSSVELD
jgi:hypothetical protein